MIAEGPFKDGIENSPHDLRHEEYRRTVRREDGSYWEEIFTRQWWENGDYLDNSSIRAITLPDDSGDGQVILVMR
jgi:hypothetical protein